MLDSLTSGYGSFGSQTSAANRINVTHSFQPHPSIGIGAAPEFDINLFVKASNTATSKKGIVFEDDRIGADEKVLVVGSGSSGATLGSIYAPNLRTATNSNVVGYDSSTGEFTVQATGSGGGGSSITVKDDGTTRTTAVTEFNFVGGKVTEPSTDVIRVEIADRVSATTNSSGMFGLAVAPPDLTGYANGGLLKIRVGSTDYFIPAFVVSGGA